MIKYAGDKGRTAIFYNTVKCQNDDQGKITSICIEMMK